ncbi:hypothetical protein [Burkholderia multivorans]|uniref:hypothetical protein n=1 Tax=Burkholderia multivorans TaxID=87883 RepID=UPI001ABA53E3|nr:hypothetical protein [Burkholderia multivorans]
MSYLTKITDFLAQSHLRDLAIDTAETCARGLAAIWNRLTDFPFMDFLVNASGAFVGGLAVVWVTVGLQGFKSLRSKLRRPSVNIERRRTPENIFTGLELGAPAQWVQEQLGAPTRVGPNWWGYRFSDSLVSLRFSADDSLERIAVALTDPQTHFNFPAWHFDCPPLGKITLQDLPIDHHLQMDFRESTRHSELIITGREGPKGACHYITFGALDPHMPGPLLPSSFEWDKEKKMLVSRPESVSINWAEISTSPEHVGFPWDFGLTIG